MSRKLTPAYERERRNLHAELTNSDFSREAFKASKRPICDALRIVELDCTTVSETDIFAELEKIREIAFQVAEAKAGMDEVEYWNGWQFDKITTPELVVRLC